MEPDDTDSRIRLTNRQPSIVRKSYKKQYLKSGCIRFGVKHSNECSDLVFTFSWTDCLSYFGNTLISAKRFSVDLKPVQVKFFWSFNAIYGEISKAMKVL